MSTPRYRSAPPSLSGSAMVVSKAMTPSSPFGTSIKSDIAPPFRPVDEAAEDTCPVTPARVATEEDAAAVARLLTEFRDHQGRDWPDDASFLESVGRLMADPDTEFLLAGEPEDGVCQ